MVTQLQLKHVAAGSAVELLKGLGFSSQAASDKAKLFSCAADNLRRRGLPDETPLTAHFVPGRIEVLGKHTDYAGGRSLLAAVEKGFSIIAAPREDRGVAVWSADAPDTAKFELSGELHPPVGNWSNYPMTVARRIARNFPGRLVGADIAITSDLPIASGMSSSSALMVACFLALADINDLSERPEYKKSIHSRQELAEYLGTVENGQTYNALAGDKGVGTFGGSEDHTSMLCCKAGMLSQYSFCPVNFEREITLPDEVVFVVGSSGVAAEKTGQALQKYNRASRLASAVAEVWRNATGRNDPHIAAAIAGNDDAVEKMRQVLRTARHDNFTPADLLDRFEQFYAESEQIIPAAGDALTDGDIGRFGLMVDRSQHLTETKLKNQVEETIFLARSARECGASAASAFGAGFGGSVWSLIQRDRLDGYVEQWRGCYCEAYPQHAERARFFATQAAPAAVKLTADESS